MKRRLGVSVVVGLLAVSACGSGGTATLSPAAAIRAAATQSTSGSSKLDIQIDSSAGGQNVSIAGTGAFGYSSGVVTGSMTISVGQTKIEERVTGGNLYLQIPGQPGFYKIALSALVGTSLADSSNPTSQTQVLTAIGDDAKKVGTQTIRGTKTTHYSGTIDVATALSKLGGFAAASVKKLQQNGVAKLPVEVYLDSKGRLRRMTEHVTLTVKGVPTVVDTRIDFYDYGTSVDVQVPSPDQVHDGSALLNAIKAQTG